MFKSIISFSVILLLETIAIKNMRLKVKLVSGSFQKKGKISNKACLVVWWSASLWVLCCKANNNNNMRIENHNNEEVGAIHRMYFFLDTFFLNNCSGIIYQSLSLCISMMKPWKTIASDTNRFWGSPVLDYYLQLGRENKQNIDDNEYNRDDWWHVG